MPCLGFMYKGFFKDDRPALYCQIISIKQLADFFNSDFSGVTALSVQKFIKKYNFKNIFQIQVSDNVLKGRCCYDFIRERDCNQADYPFPSNSASNQTGSSRCCSAVREASTTKAKSATGRSRVTVCA